MDMLFWLNVIVALQFLIILKMGWRLFIIQSYMPIIEDTNEKISFFMELFNGFADIISVDDFEKKVAQQAEEKSNEISIEEWDNLP